MQITAANIKTMSRTAAPRIVQGIVAGQQSIFDNGIDTPLRLCHFLAQLAHESAHFGVTREFASGKEYEGRHDLGNTEPGDGPRFRGRGLIQTTGRTNYAHATTALRRMDPAAPDFVAQPAQLEEFPWALLAGISYWQGRGINRYADADDVRAVTRAINGGLRGIDSRKQYLAKAKSIWIDDQDPLSVHGVLKRGSEGNDVVDLQNELVDAGYAVRADGDFGLHTEEAVKDFQTRHGLTNDGVVGARTWALLLSVASIG